MQEIRAFKELISTPKRVVITTHFKPDADALGSSLGLASYLIKKGHQVQVITPSDYPDFLNWMKGEEDVINFEEEGKKEVSSKIVAEADIIFCLDFNSLDRINGLGTMVGKSKAVKVLIDHHQHPDDFADYMVWSTKAAATAELVYKLIVDLEDKSLIDADLAECLYAGIMTDTGQFKHPNTTQNVHIVTAELMGMGADVAKVGKLIYDNNSLSRLKFMGFALSRKLKVLNKSCTAYFALSAEELQKYQTKTGDTEGLVNYALSLKGVVFSALITEREDCIRLSLRSKGNFNVSKFAKEHFDGGGHPNAAGGISNLSFEDTVKKFVQLLPNYKNELNENYKREEEL